MFGQHDDNQQQTNDQQNSSDASLLNAALSDPLANEPSSSVVTGDQIINSTAPQADMGAPEISPTSTPDPVHTNTSNDSSSSSSPTNSSTDNLVDIKKQALQHLSPLVNQLDQTPEEKFRTTMMLIQASDNKDLIKDAFSASKDITDDKARAQALLDVINEINYFTQR